VTITEANAANAVADELIAQARSGAEVSEATRQAMCSLLKSASKALSAGYDEQRFKIALAAARRLAVTRSRARKAGA